MDPSFLEVMKDTNPKIGLLNHIGGGNLGDDATLDAVMQSIRTRWPHAEIYALTMNPENTELRHGVPSYQIRRQTWSIECQPAPGATATWKRIVRSALGRFKVISWLVANVYALAFRLPVTLVREFRFLLASHRLIQRFDLLVICGGGQLTERDGPWAFPYTLLKWVLLSKLSKVKCVFLNVGAGPLSHFVSRTFIRRALLAAQYVSFRDNESQMLAREVGFAGRSVVFPDSVYSLRCPSLAPCTAIARVQAVGFAAVPYGDPRLHPKEKDSSVYDSFLAKCKTINLWLIARGYSVTLFGTDVGVDALVNADILTTLRQEGTVRLPPYAEVETVEGLLRMISAMDYIVTCRYHGVVFAHLLNKPVLAIAHHPKVTHLMNVLGLSKYCVDIRSFDPIRVTDTFTSLVNDTDAVKKSMAGSLAEYKTRLATQFDDLFPPGFEQAYTLTPESEGLFRAKAIVR